MTSTGLDRTTPISCRPWGWTSYPCTFPIKRSPSKGRKLKKVAMIKAHIGSLLYDSMECQQPRQPLQRNMQQKVTSSLSEVETDSQGDVVDRVFGSSPSTLSDESSPETEFIPEPRAETLPPSKYERKRARAERGDYDSWEKTVFWYNISTPVNNLD